MTGHELQTILLKAIDTTKLILVQRVRHDKTGDHITKKWVSAGEVKATDAVLENKNYLPNDHPALMNKPKQSGTPKGFVNPMAKLAAKKKQKAAGKSKSEPTPKPVPVKPEPISVKKKADNQPAGKMTQTAVGKQSSTGKKLSAGKKQESKPKAKAAAGKETDTYAKKKVVTPKEKPPIVRSDVNALGNTDMDSAKIQNILESVRADGDSAALSDKIAENDREKAYVTILNTITDGNLLKKIAYTGIIPADGDATKFVENKLYERYQQMENAPKEISGYKLSGANACIAQSITGYFSKCSLHHVEGALRKTSLAGADYVFRMTYPAESSMLLGSLTRGNRQVWANSDTMERDDICKTSPQNLFASGKWFAKEGQSPADGIRSLIKHIADREPTLKQECSEWEAQFNEVMTASGGDIDKMSLALNNTYDKVADTFTPHEYNTVIDGVLKLYGASLSDDGNTAFAGDYTQLTAADCIRMTYSTTGTMERQAVISNIMNAFHIMEFADAVSTVDKNTKTYTEATVNQNLDALSTMSLDTFRDMQAYVSNTFDRPSAKESNPNYLRSMRSQIALRADNGEELFSEDPSPVLDVFRGVIESASSLQKGNKAKGLKSTKYTPDMLKPAEEIPTPDFGDDELLGLRTLAFSRATCTIHSVTELAYDSIKEEMEYKEEAPKYNKTGKEMYKERHIVVRGAYAIQNSVMEEKFSKRRKEDGVKSTTTVYHGTGFGAGCAILHDGQFRVSGVDKHSGQTLGPGIYVGRSTGKVAPYAATGQCYAAELSELVYDGDGYSQNDFADGIIFKMRMSKGKKSVTAKSISGAYHANKHCGGSADTVMLPASHGGYKAWEAVATDSDLVCPDVMVDTGLRYDYIEHYIHSKNISRLDTYGPKLGIRTTRKDAKSLMDKYLSMLGNRAR